MHPTYRQFITPQRQRKSPPPYNPACRPQTAASAHLSRNQRKGGHFAQMTGARS